MSAGSFREAVEAGWAKPSITVRAPATTANLGPGFDCLGAALSIGLRATVRLGGDGSDVLWAVNVREGEPDPGPGLILDAIGAVAGSTGSVSAITVSTDIPIGRGLGSSAAAVAAGLVAGCAIAGREPDPVELLALGIPIEGHPDNLAPALFGGLVVAVPTAGGVEALTLAPPPSVRPAIVVPRERLSTAEARRALPASVPFADAVANVSRASGLVALLTGAVEATSDRLLACTEDRLHQRHRTPLMPATAAAVETFRAAGIAAVVSGAGPSVACLVPDQDRARFRDVASGMDGWDVLELEWDAEGARIE